MLQAERRWIWRTTPTVAARTIVSVSWMTPLEYGAEEIGSHGDPDFKVVEVSVGEHALLELHCLLDSNGDTLVESFRPSELPQRLAVLAMRYLDEVERRAGENRLLRRPMGYRSGS